ncbi:hypothetical protein GUITHDRAFT_119997 [Guillardia theta CCMP2712]|uniref:Uncharacterized protein n=1 Tax=Guillardia theta (strain CCMP2712) TaxID=905079 RepID=L1ICN5_GUITC|nr:hypothetical protein GUITHDRAFT_119997 [Guillardia theta CCMP2712]EKX33827.1 hypothetical protein GUITHDRAFT_119997 [Guillardia theta CCMP2712]|mmetsp:Transcript_39354/g.124022  ORF Transcript_39354/g.124022 Transcript_39354/m.124022 type:complete len:130 (-) Transcript_39354:67-456(-)|eukprot:XP_005820807.1 hypothetical protein GUITHDRAFT_119997 [Guillardia theta CCMP2712]
MAASGGPDTLYQLQGHVANYGNWSFDIYDESPRKIQMFHVPPEWAASNFGLGVRRVDEISLSIFDASSSSSRVVAFSRSSPASVAFQCDGGSNYQGLVTLILNSGVSSFRQRTLYGCFEQALGTIPSKP